MRPLHAFYAILVAAIWGGNFVAAKIGVAYFPPFLLTAIRFTIVGALILPFVPVPNRQQLWGIAQVSLVLGTLHFSLLFAAIGSGLHIASAAVIGQLGVPFACLLGAIFLEDKLGMWRSAGMMISFLGIVIVAGTPNILANYTAFLTAVAAAFFWEARIF